MKRLILYVVNLCTKFKVCCRSRDTLGGVKFSNVSRDLDHAPFRDDLTSAGSYLLALTYRPNLKFLTTPIMKIWDPVQNAQNGVGCGTGVTQGHRQCHHSIERMDFLFHFNRNHASILYRFYRAMLCIRGTSHGPVSVRPSVSVSVTSRCSTKTAKRRITETTPHDSAGNLVFRRQRSPRNSTGVTPYGGAKCRWGGSKSATFDK